MFDIKWIRENPETFDNGLKRRGLKPLSAELLKLDEKRRKHLTELQEMQQRRNQASKDIGKAMAAKDQATADKLKGEVASLKDKLQSGEEEERRLNEELERALAVIPNLPLDDVPDGKDENDNKLVRTVGEPPKFDFAPKQHFEIGEALGLMDFDTAAKISGARFVILKGALSRLERAIACFMLDQHTGEFGYTEYQPPLLVRDEAAYGTGNLPKFAEDLFVVGRWINKEEQFNILEQESDAAEFEPGQGELEKELTPLEFPERFDKTHWLIPTAEVPLTNMVRETILSEDQLPMRCTAWTPCFRSEAGAAGKDTRGMIRQHQFSKVELVSITTPEKSLEEHERMTDCAEKILQRLGLAYRTMLLCTGDMGFASQKTYDLEVWLPGQNSYREISSCSVCGDFQSRRMGARYRSSDGKDVRYVHTLNGSGVAVGRTLVAVLENYQNADGTVTIPEALRPYMGGADRIEKAR